MQITKPNEVDKIYHISQDFLGHLYEFHGSESLKQFSNLWKEKPIFSKLEEHFFTKIFDLQFDKSLTLTVFQQVLLNFLNLIFWETFKLFYWCLMTHAKKILMIQNRYYHRQEDTRVRMWSIFNLINSTKPMVTNYWSERFYSNHPVIFSNLIISQDVFFVFFFKNLEELATRDIFRHLLTLNCRRYFWNIIPGAYQFCNYQYIRHMWQMNQCLSNHCYLWNLIHFLFWFWRFDD